MTAVNSILVDNGVTTSSGDTAIKPQVRHSWQMCSNVQTTTE